MTLLTADEHRQLLTNANHSNVQIIEEPNKGWLCAVATKPTPNT
jgi:hypothetical protein